MKLETAIKVLKEQSEFLGLNFSELLVDVAKYGKMLYSDKVVEALEVYEFQFCQ